jgi:hypothetical protein
VHLYMNIPREIRASQFLPIPPYPLEGASRCFATLTRCQNNIIISLPSELLALPQESSDQNQAAPSYPTNYPHRALPDSPIFLRRGLRIRPGHSTEVAAFKSLLILSELAGITITLLVTQETERTLEAGRPLLYLWVCPPGRSSRTLDRN